MDPVLCCPAYQAKGNRGSIGPRGRQMVPTYPSSVNGSVSTWRPTPKALTLGMSTTLQLFRSGSSPVIQGRDIGIVRQMISDVALEP